MFHLMFSLPWLIVATRFIAPLPWPWMVKLLLAAFLLLASQYHLFSRFTSGSVFAPEFPRPLVIGFNLFFGAIVLLAAMPLHAHWAVHDPLRRHFFAHREDRELLDVYHILRARIERQIESRTLMLSGVSHDLRTPLTRLKLGLSFLPED